MRIGQEEGAKLVLGGRRPDDAPDGGYYFEPTIFTEVDNSMTIAQEEIFGPVLSVIKFKYDDEAIRIANDSIYGLASAVWSEDYDRCLETAKKLRAGTVWINDHHLINCIAPFGGYKQSGIGRELGTYGLDEYTEVKHVHVDLTRDPERKMFGVLLSEESASARQDVRNCCERSCVAGCPVSFDQLLQRRLRRCASGFQPSCFFARSVFISTGLRTLWIQADAAG